MKWPFRRHRESQSEAPTPTYQVPVAFGSSLTFLCDCGQGMYPSAVVNGTETSKTIRMTCGGCKRILDATLDAGYAIEAVTRAVAPPDKDPDLVALSQAIRERVAMWRTPDLADVDPDALMREVLAYHRPADRTLTARQVLAVVLMQVPSIAGEIDYAQTLVDDILLALDANGLSIVASTEVEDAPEVLGRARQDRPPGW